MTVLAFGIAMAFFGLALSAAAAFGYGLTCGVDLGRQIERDKDRSV